jgi:hypothetical protein
MIANLQPYPEYKESGQVWLGRVPWHWPVLPNRALFAEVKEREHTDEEMLSVTITQGVIRPARRNIQKRQLQPRQVGLQAGSAPRHRLQQDASLAGRDWRF